VGYRPLANKATASGDPYYDVLAAFQRQSFFKLAAIVSFSKQETCLPFRFCTKLSLSNIQPPRLFKKCNVALKKLSQPEGKQGF